MAKEIIGLDISDYSIEAVLLHKKGKTYNVESYSRFRLSPDIVEDGDILNKDKLKEALNQTFFHAQPKQIKASRVFLSVPESKVFTKVISLPDDLSEKDLKNAAKGKAMEIIPEDSDNLVSSMKVLPVNDGFRDVLYSAAQLGPIKDLVDVFKELKIEIVGITTEAVSSYAGLDDSLKDKTTLIMDIGNRTTIASIFDANGIRDTINVNIAGENVIKSLVAKTGVSYNVAEEKMRDVGMVYSVEHGETMMIVQGQLQPLLDEVKVFINYFEQSTNKKIEQLVLIGGLGQMKGIDKYFGENLSLPVVRGTSFLGDKILPNQASSTKYINAIGLARFAHEGSEINFYNEDFKKSLINKKEDKEDKEDVGKSENTKSVKKEEFGDDVKILEEEIEEDDYDDSPKPFYKNKFVATALILVVLISIAVILQSYWLPLFQKNEEPIEPVSSGQSAENKPPAEEKAVEQKKIITKNILVGLENTENFDFFIAAEEFEKSRSSIHESSKFNADHFNIIAELGTGSLVGTEKPIEGEEGLGYFSEEDDFEANNIFNDILNKLDTDMLSSLNISTLEEGYYLIPSIMGREYLDIIDEGSGDTQFNTSFIYKYKFWGISDEKVAEMLEEKISEEEKIAIEGHKIFDREYRLVNKNEDNIFEIEAIYTYLQ